MKRSEINQSENSFGIQLSNKCQMSINNVTNNTVIIGPVISTTMHPNSSLLSTALNTPRSNFTLLAKPSPSSYKVVNLSKCQPLPTLNKDNPNAVTNNQFVQFVTPIINNTPISLNDNSNLSHSIAKVDNNVASVVLTNSANQTMTTSNNPITCTRFILHSSQAPILPHGTVTIIPQHSDGVLLNNQLIKNTRYALTGMKHSPQAIRPITACSTSNTSQSTISKQSISKITPSKSMNNYTFMTEGLNTIAIQNLTGVSRGSNLSRDQQRCVSKSTPIKPINCTITSSNNIRLALTSSITNSKVNVVNPTKIQLISPKSRKRSASPTNTVHDEKINDTRLVLKDENMENPVCYNSQSGSYSPARKRARKQHLKSSNHKLQKLGTTNKADFSSVINNIRQSINDKSMSAVISLTPTTTKSANIITQTKPIEFINDIATSVINHNNPQIIIPLKNPIHISRPSTMGSLYNNHPSSNNDAFHSTENNASTQNQVQIISQTSQIRSPISHNLIFSPKFTKTLTTFLPQKVIHIAPSKILHKQCDEVKNEKINQYIMSKDITINADSVVEKENVKVEVSEVKSEICDNSNIKYSLFPYKYNWNARRTHFEKKCDLKIKKRKVIPNLPQSNSENTQDKISLNDVDISDTSWRLYKVCNQFMLQQSFDEENLNIFHKLKDKYEIKPAPSTNIDDDEPVFQRVTFNEQHCQQLPDQMDYKSSEFTDPSLFGISDDINNNHINIITEEHVLSSSPQESKPLPKSRSCSESNLFYVTEVPPFSQPPHILRILDLIEGLIVKKKKIIDKESEINDHCLQLIKSFECRYSNVNNKHPNHSLRMKALNGRLW